jgi:hypothetical protein
LDLRVGSPAFNCSNARPISCCRPVSDGQKWDTATHRKDRTVKSYKILLKYSDNLLSYLFGYFIPQHKYSKGGLLEVKILLDPFGVRQGF